MNEKKKETNQDAKKQRERLLQVEDLGQVRGSGIAFPLMDRGAL